MQISQEESLQDFSILRTGFSLPAIGEISVKGVKTRHEVIGRLKGAGLRNGEIAELVGVRKTAISQIQKKKEVQRVIKESTMDHSTKVAEAYEKMLSLLDTAAETFKDALQNEQPIHTRLKAAREVMDRAGIPVQKNTNTNINTTSSIFTENHSDIVMRAKELRNEQQRIQENVE